MFLPLAPARLAPEYITATVPSHSQREGIVASAKLNRVGPSGLPLLGMSSIPKEPRRLDRRHHTPCTLAGWGARPRSPAEARGHRLGRHGRRRGHAADKVLPARRI